MCARARICHSAWVLRTFRTIPPLHRLIPDIKLGPSVLIASACACLKPPRHFTSPKPIFKHKNQPCLARVPGRLQFQGLMETGRWKACVCQASRAEHLVWLSRPHSSTFSLPLVSATAPAKEKEREILSQLLKTQTSPANKNMEKLKEHLDNLAWPFRTDRWGVTRA